MEGDEEEEGPQDGGQDGRSKKVKGKMKEMVKGFDGITEEALEKFFEVYGKQGKRTNRGLSRKQGVNKESELVISSMGRTKKVLKRIAEGGDRSNKEVKKANRIDREERVEEEERRKAHIMKETGIEKDRKEEERPEEKYIQCNGKWVRSCDMDEEEKERITKGKGRFGANHRGGIIVSARLMEKYCTRNKEANILKIVAQIHKDKFNVIKTFPIGFNVVDMEFENIYEANRCLDRYAVMNEEDKRIEVRIIERNMKSKGVIKDWELDMPLGDLVKAIDDKRGIISVERMRTRYFDKQESLTKWKFSPYIIITMEGNVLPRELKLWNGTTGIKIRPFVEQARQCYNCYKYGHFKNFVRGKRNA